MSFARLLKMVGIVALVIGIIGFFLPGNFLYSPTIEAMLSQYGSLILGGISTTPQVQMLIAKAPAILLALFGFVLLFWGTVRSLLHPEPSAPPRACRDPVRDEVARNAGIPQKYPDEIDDRKKW